VNALEIVRAEWMLVASFAAVFTVGYVAAEVLCIIDRDRTVRVGTSLDGGRKRLIAVVHDNIYKDFGVVRAILVIFAINFVGGALFWSTLGGMLIVFPFVHYALLGFLISSVSKAYPERFNWLTVGNIVLEVGAFMVAAVGGIRLGLSVFVGGEPLAALARWANLLFVLVIPSLLIAAVFEGFLFRRLHMVEGRPWPHGIGR